MAELVKDSKVKKIKGIATILAFDTIIKSKKYTIIIRNSPRDRSAFRLMVFEIISELREKYNK